MESVDKSEIIDKIANDTGVTSKDTSSVVNDFTKVIGDIIASGKKAQLVGFGSFVSRHHNARMGHNPQTGKPLKISARNTPAFKAGSTLRKKVNNK